MEPLWEERHPRLLRLAELGVRLLTTYVMHNIRNDYAKAGVLCLVFSLILFYLNQRDKANNRLLRPGEWEK